MYSQHSSKKHNVHYWKFYFEGCQGVRYPICSISVNYTFKLFKKALITVIRLIRLVQATAAQANIRRRFFSLAKRPLGGRFRLGECEPLLKRIPNGQLALEHLPVLHILRIEERA